MAVFKAPEALGTALVSRLRACIPPTHDALLLPLAPDVARVWRLISCRERVEREV